MRVFFIFAFLGALLLYGGALQAPFHFDDGHVIETSRNIHLGTRPLGFASFWVSSQVLQVIAPVFPWSVAFYYRFGNVLIHVLAATALFWLARELTEKTIIAAIAGVLFLVHPVQTQAVTYISQRFESLATLFILLTAAAYVRFRKSMQSRWLVAALGFAAAAAMTKETAIVLSVWLLFLEVVFFGTGALKKHVRYVIPVGIVVLILLIPAWNAFRGSRGTLTSIPWTQYFATQGPILTKYLELSVWPRQQFLFYDFPLVESFTAGVLLKWLLALAVIGLGVFSLKWNRVIGFGILSFFILLLPIILLPLPDIVFEHRVYPGFAGLALAAAAASQAHRRKSAIAIVAVLAVLYGVKTVMRNAEWNDQISFLETHRAAFPHDPSILTRLASYYYMSGYVNKALALNLEARKYEDRYTPYYSQQGHVLTAINLASIYLAKNNPQASKAEGLRAVAANSEEGLAWRALGYAQLTLGETEAARKSFEKYVEKEPGPESWDALKAAAQLSGDTATAKMAVDKMVEEQRRDEDRLTPAFEIPKRYASYALFIFILVGLMLAALAAWTVWMAVQNLRRALPSDASDQRSSVGPGESNPPTL